MRNKNNCLIQIAKIIRIVSAPPIMTCILLLYLKTYYNNVFVSSESFIASIVSFVLLPILAYPIHLLISKRKKDDRNNQRKFAFIFTLVGYSLLALYSLLSTQTEEYKLIVFSYFLSLIILIIFNKLLHFKASGHAASSIGSLIFIVFFQGIKALVPCIIVTLLIQWASIQTKRHTHNQFVVGILIFLGSFIMCYWIL